MVDVDALAERLDAAAARGVATPQLTDPLTLPEAYRVQAASLARRYARGERRVGVKMGFTSRAKMVQMGITDVIWGRLTDTMIVADGGAVEFERFVHPRAEPEIAFLVGRDLSRHPTAIEVAAAVEAVGPAIEIIDSRYENFRFSLTDVVADNSSASAFVVGRWHRPDLDISNLGLVLEVNGRPASHGSSAALLGEPLRSLAAAIRLAADAGEPIGAGSIVLAGGATAAVALARGDVVELTVQALGSCSFRVS